MGPVTIILWSLAAYLIGAIPFGLLLTRTFGAGDLRAIGSGNIGATNVLRTGRRDLALATLLLDGGKGAAAVLLARHFTGSEPIAAIAGLAAFAGHVLPWWSWRGGGKGVATMLGVTLAAWWPAGVAALAAWLAAALATRYSSVGGITASLAAPVVFAAGLAAGAPWLPAAPVAWLVALSVIAVVLIARHHENIARLRAGTEAKIGATMTADHARPPIGHNGGPALDDPAEGRMK